MSGDYTAIVYLHGIGAQRRYEEISRLIDSLDQFAESQDPYLIGRLRGLGVEFERSRTAGDQDGSAYFSYIGFHRQLTPLPGSNRKTPIFDGAFRLYEGYWSSIIAGGLSPEKVLAWILARTPTPLVSLLSPWRAHMRLKLSYLFRLQIDDPLGDADNKSAYEQIAASYDRFESWAARRKYPEGKYAQFVDHLRTDAAAKRKDREELVALAGRWRRRFVRSQLIIFLRLITFIAAVLGLATFAFYATAPFISKVDLPLAQSLAAALPQQPPPLLTSLIAPIVIFSYIAGRNFLRDFVGDVTFWTAREGKSGNFEKRLAILERAVDVIRHVLLDESCKRIVVIGHSLGSSIGYQALLELGKRRRGLGKLPEEKPHPYPHEKISHFVTIGSPIETIHYFFELLYSRYHRYNRIANDVQGSINSEPFRRGRSQAIKWVNLYSAADPVSAPIFSQGKLTRPPIEEMEVISGYAPGPVSAHSGYFTASLSVARLFNAAILNDEERASAPPAPPLARALSRSAVRALHAGLFAMAWTLFLAAVGYWLSNDLLMRVGLSISLAAGLALAILWAVLKPIETVFPLDIDGQARQRARKAKAHGGSAKEENALEK